MSFVNLGSLLLGLLAWVIPIVNLLKNNKTKQNIYSFTSLIFCTISLLMQIIYINHLVKKEDWSALMDTSNAVMFASSLLFLVTLILNIIALIVCKTSPSKYAEENNIKIELEK